MISCHTCHMDSITLVENNKIYTGNAFWLVEFTVSKQTLQFNKKNTKEKNISLVLPFLGRKVKGKTNMYFMKLIVSSYVFFGSMLEKKWELH